MCTGLLSTFMEFTTFVPSVTKYACLLDTPERISQSFSLVRVSGVFAGITQLDYWQCHSPRFGSLGDGLLAMNRRFSAQTLPIRVLIGNARPGNSAIHCEKGTNVVNRTEDENRPSTARKVMSVCCAIGLGGQCGAHPPAWTGEQTHDTTHAPAPA